MVNNFVRNVLVIIYIVRYLENTAISTVICTIKYACVCVEDESGCCEPVYELSCFLSKEEKSTMQYYSTRETMASPANC